MTDDPIERDERPEDDVDVDRGEVPFETVHVAPEHGLHGARSQCFVCGGPIEQVAMVPVEAATLVGDLREAIIVGLSSYFHGTTDGSVGKPAEGVSDRYPIITNPGTVEDAADRILAALSTPTPEGEST